MATLREFPTPPTMLKQWLDAEYTHSRSKFGVSQAETLIKSGLSNNGNFGGQAANYWGRMHEYDQNASLHRAQYAAKMANTARMLWATIRSFEWGDNKHAVALGAKLIQIHTDDGDYHQAKQYIDNPDFYDTPVGMGMGYLEDYINRYGVARKFRLGELVRAQQIMEDAGDVAALQFEWTLQATGELPKPGLPSGYIETW